MLIESKHTSQSGHWYTKEGNAAYTIVGKNGKERNTTLKDARDLGLVPSVTTIIALAAKPLLENWKQDQILYASLTLTRNPDESEQNFVARIKKDAKEQSRKAAEKGTIIHAWVQEGFEGKKLSKEAEKFYLAAKEEIEKYCGKKEWIVEESFATETYGGKIDIQNDEYIIDFKTTEKDLDQLKTWEDHHMQLSAYDRGKGRKCAIVYINVNTAKARLIFVEEADLLCGYKCFLALVNFWRAKNRID